jgi:putative transposase
MRKAFKYRLYPTATQQELLRMQLSEACRLYNAALQERRDAYRSHGESLNYYTQANQLKEIRDAGDLSLPNYHCAQDVLKRLDKAFQAFFQRIKRREKPGFPRFKSARRYDSITFPSHGDGNRLLKPEQRKTHLRVQGVGEIKILLHRPIVGEIKTVSVKRECEDWYACFSVGCAAKPLPLLDNSVGIDVGLESFAVLSNGESIPNPRWYRVAQKRLRRAQRKVARRVHKRSHRRRKAILALRNIHRRIYRLRNDFQHKQSFQLIQNFGTIAIEDLNIKGLAGGMLSKAVYDVGWASFFSKIAYKAESAGRILIKVNPAGTSQTCLCGAAVRKLLSNREHVCIECGLVAPRDFISAQVILQRARISPSNQNVEAVSSCVV